MTVTPEEFAGILNTAVVVAVGAHVAITAFQLIRKAANSV